MATSSTDTPPHTPPTHTTHRQAHVHTMATTTRTPYTITDMTTSRTLGTVVSVSPRGARTMARKRWGSSVEYFGVHPVEEVSIRTYVIDNDAEASLFTDEDRYTVMASVEGESMYYAYATEAEARTQIESLRTTPNYRVSNISATHFVLPMVVHTTPTPTIAVWSGASVDDLLTHARALAGLTVPPAAEPTEAEVTAKNRALAELPAVAPCSNCGTVITDDHAVTVFGSRVCTTCRDRGGIAPGSNLSAAELAAKIDTTPTIVLPVTIIEVCSDCTMAHANGVDEYAELDTEHLPWSLLPGADVALDYHEDNSTGLDVEPCCHFSATPCAACGTRLAGDRYSFVVFSWGTDSSDAAAEVI